MGPLAGIKIVELAGIGPGPMCAMLLADLGATVIRIDRLSPSGLGVERPLEFNYLLRNRKSLALDLKAPESVELVLRLIEKSDALIEGFRPGVTERLGLGPDACLARNPALVYGRMTGWGQTGPLAQAAGHDLNYIAVTGALAATGHKGQPPSWPLNLLGDYAGGSLYLAFGIVSALLNARATGEGQVVDAAIVDGTASLMTSVHGLRAAGTLMLERGTNILDSGAPFYNVYECSDGRWVSFGAIEGKFYQQLLDLIGVDAASLPPQLDRESWPQVQAVLANVIKTKSRDEWCAILEGTDACFAPVLDLDEAPTHPHLQQRGTYIEVGGKTQPAPAPRFSKTQPAHPFAAEAPVGKDRADDVLAPWFDGATLAELRAAGMIG